MKLMMWEQVHVSLLQRRSWPLFAALTSTAVLPAAVLPAAVPPADVPSTAVPPASMKLESQAVQTG